MDFGASQGAIFPGIQLQGAVELLVQHLIASLRIGAFFLSSPFLGSRYVQPTIKIMMALVLTILIADKTPMPDSNIIGSALGIAIIIKEIAIGLCVGLILTIWFAAGSLAGEKVASSSGLGFASQMDPDAGGQTPVVAQLFMLFLTVVFLSLDGHLIAISVIMKSYEISPIAEFPNILTMVDAGIKAAGWMFMAASLIMLPVVSMLLMINVTIGIITRSAPTLNLFSFGFPISMISVFIILYSASSVIGFAFSDLVDMALEHLESVIGGLGVG